VGEQHDAGLAHRFGRMLAETAVAATQRFDAVGSSRRYVEDVGCVGTDSRVGLYALNLGSGI
jgi:hypothetical protein